MASMGGITAFSTQCLANKVTQVGLLPGDTHSQASIQHVYKESASSSLVYNLVQQVTAVVVGTHLLLIFRPPTMSSFRFHEHINILYRPVS